MELKEEILRKACTTGCPRYDDGNCPYSYFEKDICSRVKEVLKNIESDGEHKS